MNNMDRQHEEVVIRLVDGRMMYGYILNESKPEKYSFISTSKYADYLRSKSTRLVQYLPVFLVASIVTH
jgi:hypothetical protein